MSETTNRLNHSTWECKYHVVFTPKYRRKVLYGHLRRELREVLHRLSRQKECEILEGHLMPDHVHMLLSIPPKSAVAHVIGFMKGKSAIWIAQNIKNQRRNFAVHKFWARGYFVSTTGANEQTVREYIRNQEIQDKRLDDLFNRQSVSQPLRAVQAKRPKPPLEVVVIGSLSRRDGRSGRHAWCRHLFHPGRLIAVERIERQIGLRLRRR